MPSKEKYTDPELRDQVKQEIQDSDKGGAPGQWSARKAQMMASEYKKRGGDYNTDKSEKDESQKNLDKWGDEEWQTKEGSGSAKKEDGTEKRYLPKEAWENMTEEEKEETDNKKQEESKKGKQHVANTEAAKESKKEANQNGQNGKAEGKRNGKTEKRGEDEDGTDDNIENNNADGDIEDDEEKSDDDAAEDQANGADAGDDEEGGDDKDGNDEKASAGQKRSKHSNGGSKKQKFDSSEGRSKGTVGSKHDSAEEPAPRGSKDRLPKQGQQIHWKAMPGYVDGEVVEVLTQNKNVDGKSVKASKSDPRIVLKSNSSGKICVHKPDACFF